MRRQSRELALQILFQTEFSPKLSISEFTSVFEQSYDRETLAYAEELIDGVHAKLKDVDARIQAASRHWKVERMASVDRNVLRIATYELKLAPSPLKDSIVIDEAVEIARKFGTTESAAFVNGVLDQIAKGS